jgi:hypothetical protein
MARKLIEMRANDTNVLVAVAVPEAAVGPVSRPGEEIIEKIDQQFDNVKDLIIRSCRPLTEAFKTLSAEGQTVSAEAEFGINFTLKGNIYLVETSGEASLKIKVTWNLANQDNPGGS